MSRTEIREIERAVQQRWPVSPEQRQKMVERLLGVMDDPAAKSREIASAARVLVMMEGQNQADEHRAQPDRHLNLTVTPEQLARMTDDELEALERRLVAKD